MRELSTMVSLFEDVLQMEIAIDGIEMLTLRFD
jgi:hypothetical protein